MKNLIISFVFLILLVSCSQTLVVEESPSSTEIPLVLSTKTPAPPTSTLTPTEIPTATPDRVFIDMSGATLEHPIAPECIDQFPVVVDDGLAVVCFTFDNWVRGPVRLNDGYEMIIGAEGWMEQNEQQVRVLIPIATGNRAKNQMQLNNTLVRDFPDWMYDADDGFWEGQAKLKPGDTIYVQIAMPSQDLASNSTQGFGFEAVQFTQAELDRVFLTGDFSIIGNLIWPAIDIEGRN